MLENLKLAKKYDGFLYLAESARNPPTLLPHHHVELELNLVVRGAISYVVGGRRTTFGQGTLLWLFPAQEHQLVDRTSDAQNYVAVFKPGLIARSCHSGPYGGLKRKNAEVEGVLHTRLNLPEFDLLRKTMDSLMPGAPDPDILNREAGFGVRSSFRFEHADPDGLNAGLHHLLLLSWRFHGAGKMTDGAVALHPAVRKVLDRLSADPEGPGLVALAHACGASSTHLSRMFARQVGVSISRYKNSIRLGRFLDAYRGPDQKTIAEAVYAAGFGSYAQFHRVFTQAYGQSPRASLKLNRDGSMAADQSRTSRSQGKIRVR